MLKVSSIIPEHRHLNFVIITRKLIQHNPSILLTLEHFLYFNLLYLIIYSTLVCKEFCCALILLILSIQQFVKMVFKNGKKNQQTRQLSHLDETLNDFVIGISVYVNALESEKLEQQPNGQPNDLERNDSFARQNQVTENDIDIKITRAVTRAVITVKKCMHDAILTAINKVVLPGLEMAVKSITGLTGHGMNCEVQNPEQRSFLGNIRNTPLRSALSRLDLDNEFDRNDETRNDEHFEDGDYPALKPNYDQRAHAHHLLTGHNAPHNSVPEHLTGRVQTHCNPLSQQFFQPQIMTTRFN